MKNTINKIIIAFAALFATASAHAIGAIYEIPVTIVIDTNQYDYTGSDRSSTLRSPINLGGIMRDGVAGYPTSVAASAAAVAACEAYKADQRSGLFAAAMRSAFDIDSIRIQGTFDCANADVSYIENDEFAAFDLGISLSVSRIRLNEGFSSDELFINGRFEMHSAIGNAEWTSAILARRACDRLYSDSPSRLHPFPTDNLGLARLSESKHRGCLGVNDPDNVAIIYGNAATPTPVSANAVHNPTSESAASAENSGGSNGKVYTIGGAALALGIAYFVSDGFADGDFNFAPDFAYSITESGFSANAGGRMNFRKDGWSFYWSATQQNADGEFGDLRHTSGGKYTADFWTAAFSESVAGDTADYDFSLSANLQNGIWKISPVYRLHSEYADNEFDTKNSLNLQSEFRYNNWQISPSAGFQWRNFSNFANSGIFQINAIHRF